MKAKTKEKVPSDDKPSYDELLKMISNLNNTISEPSKQLAEERKIREAKEAAEWRLQQTKAPLGKPATSPSVLEDVAMLDTTAEDNSDWNKVATKRKSVQTNTTGNKGKRIATPSTSQQVEPIAQPTLPKKKPRFTDETHPGMR
ncbi:uncharacterized protein LOC128877912 isoform X2 [Hylaeus volcanicus]|uniref:uncharacterized protein LOC128877912 isoform X2 n=1 Tax=Hylaeus volcanicus TaxID=313075 RepID=UPI0023B86D7C|nr:uncharacterized protein LOC128877912 isoform X2 [Hylaeus volcanicus]